MTEAQQQISIQDLQLSLEVYEIESEQKLEQLKKLFAQKGSLDLAKMFYEQRSSIQIKFQNIISDLIEFLIKQEVSSTEKLRKTFYRILQNPLLLLFKVSRFQIFDLRLNGFDIQLEPIQAISQLAKSLYQNIDQYISITSKQVPAYDGKQYKSWESFLEQATINKIQDKIFVFYSYLRKGSNLLKKKFESKVKIVQIFNNVQSKLLPVALKRQDSKTVKQLSVLNYEIYQLESSFDVLYFFLHIPLIQKYKQSFHQLQILGQKAKQASNYNIFILLFIKHEKQILEKLKTQKLDPYYRTFIENALKALLEMWGCRICYYKQFCQLFTLLFKLHPNQVQALQLCLKHTPDLKKDDIVLLRTNFKLQIDKKHNELLSLLKSMNLQEINQFLNNFYHRTLYNMDFKKLEREKIINLLTLMNGNSSLAQFFTIVERAFKQWNHTIDFAHGHKFIQSQFSYPKFTQDKAKESLKLLTNICALQEKDFNKQYQNLIKGNCIGKSLLQFVKFIQKDEKAQSTLSWPQTHKFIQQSLSFLRKGLNPTTQTQNLASAYSTILEKVTTQQNRIKIQQGLIQAIQNNVQSFHIQNCLNCFKQYKNQDMSKILDIFMSGISQNNELIKKFYYLQEKVQDIKKQLLPKQHAQFIQNNYRINSGILVYKDPGIFNLSDLQVMTIPSQIDKVIDNYYFTLDANSKKFTQYLIQTWNKKRNQNSSQFTFYSNLILSLINNYPIVVPLLASVRLDISGSSLRFIQLLSQLVCQNKIASQIILKIIKCKQIRYKNGKDYVQEEIVPMAMKQIIKSVNNGKNQQNCAQKFYVLAKLIQRANIADLRLETIQKSIQKLRFLLQKSPTPEQAQKYGQSFKIMMRSFFLKKQIQMKKQNLVQNYDKLIWNDVRNYVSNTVQNKSQLKNQPIIQYIIVTPFTITQQFNIQQYRIKKGNPKPKKDSQKQNLVQMNQILQKLPIFEPGQLKYNLNKSFSQQNRKKLLITNSKYDLFIYLGKQNIQNLADKENIDLIFNQNTKQTVEAKQKKKVQDTTSFIQYYMKSLAMPSINHKLILQNIITLLTKQSSDVSYLWTNSKNLQNYFVNLLSIFQFAALQSGKRKPQQSPQIKKIVQIINNDSVGVMKKVLRIFANLGYSNIWAQNFDMFWNNFPIRKFLGFGKSQQSFLSVILRNTLQNQQMRDDLTYFLGRLFQTRSGQNALMYKVTMDKNLMNIIMKSLSIPHLQKISLIFHSNFNNLRLYTDQLHQGLKALNIASKNRAYNEYLKISKSVQDQQFSGPLKLFKQNFSFFIRIQKQGYIFKKSEQTNLALGRFANLFRNAGERQNISTKVNQILQQHIKQVQQLQIAIANRVKSFYLVTKLRDLSYQNSLMIPIIHQVMYSTGKTQIQILQQINKLQIFSLMSRLYNDLVRYQDDWRNIDKYSSKTKVDGYILQNQLTLCTTKRFSHSMSKIYQKCDLQFDEVMQRCIDALKSFVSTEIGNNWLQSIDIYPAFLIKSFINNTKANKLTSQILTKLKQNSTNYQFSVQQNQLIQGLLKGFRSAPRSAYMNKNIIINYNNSKKTPIQILKVLQQKLITNQTFVILKNNNNIIFNKYKSSQATLQQIQILGYIISYAIINKIQLNINLHPSIISALSFNIAQLDYILDIDFKIWEQLRNILSVQDSASMALNFSYNFQSLDTFKPIRIQLIDKGSSKKVNNLNREQYCDLVCCYILFQYTRPHINRLLTTILSIVPKQLISCMSTKDILELFYDKAKSQKILDDYMKKIGVVLPQTLIDDKGKRIQNLKDFQNVQWLQQNILENQNLRNKYWKDQTNLFVVTAISGKGSIRVINGKFLIEHFGSKEQMKAALSKL